jgi:DNA invertase Pin-like site-specific DNA recombinase
MKIGYARVSTGEQSLDMQIDALEEAGCEKVFTDQVSGTKEERPGIEEAIEYMREGDTLVVWKLDRLGRSLTDLVEKVTGLRERGMEFESLQEQIDTTSAGGRFQFHVFSALAQFERDLISERTKAGLRAARARGKNGGRPRALTEEQVQRAADLVADSEWTINEICETFEISRSTLYRYVSPEGEVRRPGASSESS